MPLKIRMDYLKAELMLTSRGDVRMWNDVANTENKADLFDDTQFIYLLSLPISIVTFSLRSIFLFVLLELVFKVLLLLPSHQRTYNIKFTMPPEIISEPNPQALPSHLPDYIEKLTVKLDHKNLDEKTCDALLKFRRAACYIAAGKRDYVLYIYIPTAQLT